MQPEQLASIVAAAIQSAMAPLVARIAALEKSAPLIGRDGREGLTGPRGEKGDAGGQGDVGPVGPSGPSGPQGEPGGAGPEGPVGPSGLEGQPGREGRDGQPGVPGVPGRDGEKGMDGASGRDGANGADGLGFDDFEEEFDGERTITRRYKAGDRVKEFKHTFPMMIYRGLWKAGGAYARGDVVTWAGSGWHANEDTKAEPGAAPVASRAWAQMVRKGDAGKSGPIGKTGERGPQGSEGPQGRSGY